MKFVRNRYEEQSNRTEFPKKNSCRSKVLERWSKYGFFRLFLEITLLRFFGSYYTQKNNLVLTGPILDLSPNNFCLQIHNLDIASFSFANFEYDKTGVISNQVMAV